GTAGGGLDTSLTQTLTITVQPVNDLPTALPQSVNTSEDMALSITLAGTDLDGDPLNFLVVSPPAHGTLSGTAPNLTYQPAPNYHGPNSFSSKANDGQADSAPATVAIVVLPINDPPAVTPQSILTDEDTAISVVLLGSDPEGQPPTYSIGT